MMTSPPPQHTARHALWVGGMLVVLAGLFGVHGLDSHGAAGMETIPQAVMAEVPAHVMRASAEMVEASAATDVTSAAQHATAVISSVQATVDTSVTVSMSAAAHGGHGAMGMGVAEMCMAILAVALTVLLLLRIGGTVGPVLWVTARPARAPAVAGRDPDPPSLINLSIQRC